MSRSASAARMAAARVKAISSRGFGGDARIGRGGGAGDRRANRTHRGRRDASRRLRAVVPPAMTSEAATSGRARRDPMADRSARAVLLLLIVVGAILRVRGLRFGFPHPVARPDEEVLVAAAFLAVAFLHVRDSHFGVTDVPAAFLTVCAFWAALRCATEGARDARVALAGALCGLAASTKYNAAVALLPAMAAIVQPAGG